MFSSKILVSELTYGSKKIVSCRCDNCNKKYLSQFCRNTDICASCAHSLNAKKIGLANKGSKRLSTRGENHHNWNPDKSTITSYTKRVHALTRLAYNENKEIINPHNYPRGRAGVEGAYQVDHIKSIRQCFLEGLEPEIAASLDNLQMLPWKENRDKWF